MTVQRLDIYHKRQEAFEKELVRLEQLKTSQKNKEYITAWHNHLFATGSGNIWVAKLNSQIRKIVLWLEKDFDQATKADIERMVAFINRQEYWSDATKSDYRRCIKQFFIWFEEEDPRKARGDQEAVSLYRFVSVHVRTAYKAPAIDYGAIITEDDLRTVLEKGCKNAREKAFLAVLHEGGFRAGEFLNIRFKDLEVKENRVIIQVDGKTGVRRVPIVVSMGLLMRWVDEHPFKDNQQALLWVGENRRCMHQPLKHIGAQKLVSRCFVRAGVQKRHNLHWFRHSAATLKAPHMREVMLCKLFGWAIGSKQVRTYVHADVSQVEDAVLQMNGIVSQEKQGEKPVACMGCTLLNPSGTRYCQRCGKPMSVSVAMEDENKKDAVVDEAFYVMQKIMSNPELREKFMLFSNNESE